MTNSVRAVASMRQTEALASVIVFFFFFGESKIFFEGERKALPANKFTNSYTNIKKMLTQHGIIFNDNANQAVA